MNYTMFSANIIQYSICCSNNNTSQQQHCKRVKEHKLQLTLTWHCLRRTMHGWDKTCSETTLQHNQNNTAV